MRITTQQLRQLIQEVSSQSNPSESARWPQRLQNNVIKAGSYYDPEGEYSWSERREDQLEDYADDEWAYAEYEALRP